MPPQAQVGVTTLQEKDKACQQITIANSPANVLLAASELNRSRALSNAGDLGGAENAVRHSLELQTTADAEYQLALLRFGLGDARCSLAAFTAAAQLRPPRSEDLRIVALNYVLLHDEPDAEHWLRVALQLNANNAEAWYDLGRVLYVAKRYGEASAALDRTLTLQPHHVKAMTYRGLAAEMAGDTAQAEAAYRKAIADEKNAQVPIALPFRSLGVLLFQAGKLLEAEQVLRRAVEVSPADAEDHVELARCLIQEQLWAGARVELELAIHLHSSRPAWHFLLGRVDRALGLNPQAEVEFQLARTQSEATSESGPEQ